MSFCIKNPFFKVMKVYISHISVKYYIWVILQYGGIYYIPIISYPILLFPYIFYILIKLLLLQQRQSTTITTIVKKLYDPKFPSFHRLFYIYGCVKIWLFFIHSLIFFCLFYVSLFNFIILFT